MAHNFEVINILNHARTIDEGVNQILEYIGETFMVSRVYIFETTGDSGLISNTFEWCAPGINSEMETLQNMSAEEYGYNEIFSESDVFICGDSEKLKQPMKDAILRQNIKAMLQCEIINAGRFRGFIGVDDCERKRPDWEHYDKDIRELREVSSLLSLYLIKERNFQKYQQNVTAYTRAMAETNQNLTAALEQERHERETLESIAKIYDSMHLIDFKNNTFVELNSIHSLSEYIKSCHGLSQQEIMWGFMKSTICPAHVEKVIELTDFSTLEQRMENRVDLSFEALNHSDQWWHFSFIRVGDRSTPLSKVLFCSKNINESKIREETLLMMSLTDELTKVYNRHAYEQDISELTGSDMNENLRLIAIDLNGLKIANDTSGHAAGDELLTATAECCARAVNGFGKFYRTGGDEFMALVNCTGDELENILLRMDEYCSQWHGQYSESFSFSRGVVSASEMPGASIHDLEKKADHRMYEDKKLYYSGANNRRHR